MLDAQNLSKVLHEAIPQKIDGYGKPVPISQQTRAYASGVIAALEAGIFSHALVTGVTSPGSPLSNGAAAGGILVLQPSLMIAKTTVGLDAKARPNLEKESKAIINYIMTGTITFAAGNITGTCTNTPSSPGPLAAGAGTGGIITGITGSGAVGAVGAALGGIGPNGVDHYTALINYILDNLEAEYTSGSVTGVCPSGGGPLASGVGAGGMLK